MNRLVTVLLCLAGMCAAPAVAWHDHDDAPPSTCPPHATTTTTTVPSVCITQQAFDDLVAAAAQPAPTCQPGDMRDDGCVLRHRSRAHYVRLPVSTTGRAYLYTERWACPRKVGDPSGGQP